MLTLKGEYEIIIKNRGIRLKFQNKITDAGILRFLDGQTDILNFCILSSDITYPSDYNDAFISNNIVINKTTDLVAAQEDNNIAGINSTDPDLYITGPVIANKFIYEYTHTNQSVHVIQSVGISWQASGALFSRAAITPLTPSEIGTNLTIFPDDEIKIIYTLYTCSPQLEGYAAGVVMNIPDRGMTFRRAYDSNPLYWAFKPINFNPQGCLAFSDDIAASDTGPSGVGMPATSVERLPIDVEMNESPFKAKFKITWNHLAAVSPTGIKSFLISNSLGEGLSAYQISLDYAVNKTDRQSYVLYFDVIIQGFIF